MVDEAANRQAFGVQQHFCETMGAPITARICAALAVSLDRTTRTGARILDWPGEPTADALPLRTVGGLHALDLAGVAPELSRVFAGEVVAPGPVQTVLRATFAVHDDALLAWLDGPPQTNEAGRSAVLMTGLTEVARRYGLPLDLIEIGSSAGLNLLIDRFRFDLGGMGVGPADSPVVIRPDWRGAPPPAVAVAIQSVRGVEIAPVDVRDPAAAERLRAYVWADNPDRMERLTRAIAMIRAKPVALEQGDAADWVEARLAEPQPDGVVRVLMHSVVWQYLGAERQARIAAAMAQAAAHATPERPLAWVRMEPDRAIAEQQLWVQSWPGHDEPVKLARAQAHGAWIEPI
ncbi:DUF2332 domain-containing protein [Sphingomonas sp. NFR15]|uniref:DUF2332 domain-containing protein n=1 Tax=Sphingomonas sp. NFR15 TaxID=1566282 RepID=UPI00087E6BB6|nr:DUF2332 domain-containing protein [Sphingomonas sp. NFR15]SDA26725.1 hypothetical protein SAMN03159340_02054 [Sphingomonas sp. NFR15]